MCELSGIKTHMYHKNHIKKVIDVAFMAYAFNSNVENGSNGVKKGFPCVQGAHVAKSDVRQSCKTNDRKTCYDGPIVHNKGDAYLINCNVTWFRQRNICQTKIFSHGTLQRKCVPKSGSTCYTRWEI